MENSQATETIIKMSGIFKNDIPPIIFDVFNSLGDEEWDVEKEGIQEIIKLIPHLMGDPGDLKGGMVVIAGLVGNGKTSTAFAGALLLRQRFLEIHPRSILKTAFGDNEAFEEICIDERCLIIDDFGTEHFSDKGWGIGEWDYFLNLRYKNKLRTIFTTNLTPEEFTEKYNDRMFSRLSKVAKWINLTGKSLRT